MSNETNSLPAGYYRPGDAQQRPRFQRRCDYAVVELTPGLVDQIRRRVELARQAGRQDNDLYEIYFWGGTADFYDSDLPDACEDAMATDEAAQEWLPGWSRTDMPWCLPPPTFQPVSPSGWSATR